MKDKERPILYISLALNLILAVLLIISYARDPEPTAVAALPTSNQPSGENPASPTPTYTPIPRPSETSPPTATEPPATTEEPTTTSTHTLPPSPTPTDTPAPNPSQTPTPSQTPIPQPEWLVYLNSFRTLAGINPVVNNTDWSEGSRQHSVYMVETGDVTHDPDRSSPWYTDASQVAADNGNIAATEWVEATYIWAINYWMSAPFHGLPILDTELTTVGFGFHSKPQTISNVVGGVNVASTLNVLSGIVSPSFELIDYPIFFPPDGGETWILRNNLYEYPDPLAHCDGFSRPTGPPIMIQTGPGSGRPTVTSYSFSVNGNPSFACMFTESTYNNSNSAAQQSGRRILDVRDAIVIIPFNPYVVGNTYEVTITIDGETYSAEFTAVDPPY
jgi:uncharacterized protein YkwD